MQVKRYTLSCLMAAAMFTLAAAGAGFLGVPDASAALAPETFADIAQKDAPAVVNISAEKVVKGRGSREFFGPMPFPGPGGPGGPHDPFREFFDKFFGENMPRGFKQRALAAQEELDKRFAPPKPDPKADAKGATSRPADGEDEEEGSEAGGGPEKPLPPDLEAFLSDPYRAKRTRYLPPGTYTVEIGAGGKSATTRLEVKKPKAEPSWSDDD